MSKVVVMFEVTLKEDAMDSYLDTAASLKDEFTKAEGFISSERFTSVNTEGKLVSISVWESEDAVKKWRNRALHRENQRIGREELFEEYKITVMSPIREYTDVNREEAPADSNEYFGI